MAEDMPSTAPRFQSTLPVRGATNAILKAQADVDKFQSTLPVRGATCRPPAPLPIPIVISIHAPRAGGDLHQACRCCNLHISIHAPRAGGDKDNGLLQDWQGISIHAPRAGGDVRSLCEPASPAISIHAPRAGGDGVWGARQGEGRRNFNPRPPCGGRRRRAVPPIDRAGIFQSTPPVRGATPP